ncbi:hypothetical protein N1851_018729 [Merluccius polli]|uniref:HECT domain-containing protein n=1 Tax=Merluccius polli TaxID=89951 RepID=A0AA47MN56_MERPO|nr:hypothetical protein N1851_018729 [Merluccius polli]
MVNEELDYKEADSGLCHHNRVAITEQLKQKWKLIKEPTQAAKVFKENLLKEHASGTSLRMKMDVSDSEEDRERDLLLFYKRQQEWACPLHCTLVGDVAVGEGVMRYFLTTVISKLQFGFSLDLGKSLTILKEEWAEHCYLRVNLTILFQQHQRHLLKATSSGMLAHSFLHDGPHVTGLSPAVIHVLFNGDPEMATVVTEDCPDLHIRSITQLACNIKETLSCKNYCLGKYNNLYGLDSSLNKKNLHRNRRTQFQIFPCLGIFQKSPKQIGDGYITNFYSMQTMRQIKQLRKGLKGQMLSPNVLFPKMAEMQFTPQMLLQKITWPVDDSDDEDLDLLYIHIRSELSDQIAGSTLAQLLTFWVGWEMLPPELRVEISGGTLPTSSTCFETLKLPAHFKTYMDFEKALVSAINSAQTGFGLV